MSQEIKYPLGGDIYATVSKWKGGVNVHIRKYQCRRDSNQEPIVFPTKQGIVLNYQQLNQLMYSLPLIFSDLTQIYQDENTAPLAKSWQGAEKFQVGGNRISTFQQTPVSSAWDYDSSKGAVESMIGVDSKQRNYRERNTGETFSDPVNYSPSFYEFKDVLEKRMNQPPSNRGTKK